MCAAWSARTRTSPSRSARALEAATETTRTNDEAEGGVCSEEALITRGRRDGGRRSPWRLAEEGWVGIVML